MTLHRLLYRSDVAMIGSEATIRQHLGEIVATSQERNAANGLTGALLQAHGVFLQVLEGPLGAIEPTFERICCDLRHRRVELVELVPIEQRLFAEWSMAAITLDRDVEALLPSRDAMRDLGADAAGAQATVDLLRSLIVSARGRAPSRASGEAASVA
ncbi:MAG: BLUF domain-containing protein [Methylobacterium sp.]|jgi:hypothetical protein|uniref:BLUF domain-containing protein n=1 Tax=Methylobacterium sp. TaxID=409 RepID=UPI002583A81D|nr:BLUF domain-containing protein [Methylobacterium sp.]MBY0295502.1 BLUF domain-containing protein [Methylobacterium sp.]